jgi:hypothetical protein
LATLAGTRLDMRLSTFSFLFHQIFIIAFSFLARMDECIILVMAFLLHGKAVNDIEL